MESGMAFRDETERDHFLDRLREILQDTKTGGWRGPDQGK